jgi:transcriptional regulator with XRE-family HTH domain
MLSFVQRQLGWQMKQLRVNARKSRADVAVSGILSESTMSRLENGIVATHWGKIKLLCEFYGADDATTQQLIARAKAAREGDGWLEQYWEGMPPQALFVSAEQTAAEIYTYDPEVIPSALQTEDYARALFSGELLRSSPGNIDSLVDARMERRARYWSQRPDGAQLTIILGEAALARLVGGYGTMSRQRERLREIDDDRAQIRVLPWAAGAHPAIYGGYTIFRFSDPDDGPVIFFENYSGGQYLQEEDVVRRITHVWERLHGLSIPIKEYESQ